MKNNNGEGIMLSKKPGKIFWNLPVAQKLLRSARNAAMRFENEMEDMDNSGNA